VERVALGGGAMQVEDESRLERDVCDCVVDLVGPVRMVGIDASKLRSIAS
jgi:hypothetical protein